MILRNIGRAFIAAGVIILLFVLYQLFGTGFITNHSQRKLAKELRQAWAAPLPSPIPSVSPVPSPPPDLGSGVAFIEIPKIEVSRVVVEGVGIEDLKKGPGHWPGTPLPGQPGNVVISGHRTTYGAPFYRLDELKPGDEIRLTTRDGLHVYKVDEEKVVAPTDFSVAVRSQDARLTLTTCNPRFSARQRLVVLAELVSQAHQTSAA